MVEPGGVGLVWLFFLMKVSVADKNIVERNGNIFLTETITVGGTTSAPCQTCSFVTS